MRIPTALAIMAAVGAAAVAGAASAQPPSRLTDVAYIEAARCAGLASSGKLGSTDGASLSALLKAQAYNRDQTVLDQADNAQDQAKRQANRADDYMKTKLQSELSGPCSSFNADNLAGSGAPSKGRKG
jgi:hypothetical protein